MERIENYLARKNTELKASKVNEDCEDASVETAINLIQNRVIPIILRFEDGSKIIPRNYNDAWNFHLACCNRGIIYDPFFGKPLKMKDYQSEMFGRFIPHRIAVDDFTIFNYINRHIPRGQIRIS